MHEYREYGWRYYGADSMKLSKPLQILLDTYLVEYNLNSSRAVISERAYGHDEVQNIFFTQALSKADSRLFVQHLSVIQPVQIAQRCEEHPRDDGFHLDVTLIKDGSSTQFNWSGSYEPDLLNLLVLVNKLAPQRYKFYKSGQEESFKRSLLHRNEAP